MNTKKLLFAEENGDLNTYNKINLADHHTSILNNAHVHGFTSLMGNVFMHKPVILHDSLVVKKDASFQGEVTLEGLCFNDTFSNKISCIDNTKLSKLNYLLDSIGDETNLENLIEHSKVPELQDKLDKCVNLDEIIKLRVSPKNPRKYNTCLREENGRARFSGCDDYSTYTIEHG